jgi:para-aminobenzoate synthetase component 1
MIVDLLRNDFGKVCEIGSVSVKKLFELQTFSNVHHLVSTIEGKLKQKYNGADLLQACFPGGSITGAPKVRAMQIIDELEPSRRSVYCGSIVMYSAHGAMDSNIMIRTLLLANGELFCWGGGGIVADSNCESEYQESLTKIQTLLNALQENNRQ